MLENNIPSNPNISSDSYHTLHPPLPYHERLQNYIQKRNEIFKVNSLVYASEIKSKRSTIRMRRYYKMRKLSRKFLVSAIISNPSDMRYYAKVSFLNFTELGLLDTGANITCLGSELAKTNFNNLPNYTKCKSIVKTADGNPQMVTGWLDLEVTFKKQSKRMKIFIIPSISQRLILGVDFCKTFKLFPDIIGSVDVINLETVFDCLSELFDNHDKSECDLSYSPSSDDSFYSLNESQRNQLDTVISLFPNFERQGLGRTNLICHKIYVGNSTPIKQRHYPVSPAIEKLMFKEIDRMLALGVIEPSNSPWSSPMRLVVKPNKIRLCLDARKVNSVTEKDAYHTFNRRHILKITQSEFDNEIGFEGCLLANRLGRVVKATNRLHSAREAVVPVRRNAVRTVQRASNHVSFNGSNHTP